MFNYQKKIRIAFAFMAVGIVGLTSCTRDVNPREAIEDSYRELRVDSAMTAEQYQHTSELIHNPPAVPADVTVPPTPQAVTSNRVYNLTYANYATVTIGGVAYNNTIANWLAGASAGNVPINPSDFATMNAALTHQLRIVIGDNPIPWWYEYTIRPITFTMLDKGNYVLSGGLYTTDTRNYLYLGNANGAGGQVGTTSCGAMTFGALHGWMAPGYTSTTGNFSYNFIAGCWPVAISASVTFYFTGVAV